MLDLSLSDSDSLRFVHDICGVVNGSVGSLVGFGGALGRGAGGAEGFGGAFGWWGKGWGRGGASSPDYS